MVGKTKRPTSAEKKRMSLIGEQYFGCLPCRLEKSNYAPVLATVQHVVEGGKRLGHNYTYGLCCWHHFGHDPMRMGPSLALNKHTYVRRYGSERMLVELQDWLIAEHKVIQWFEYDMPQSVVRQLRLEWVRLGSEDQFFEV
jgi:hypothetical protein